MKNLSFECGINIREINLPGINHYETIKNAARLSITDNHVYISNIPFITYKHSSSCATESDVVVEFTIDEPIHLYENQNVLLKTCDTPEDLKDPRESGLELADNMLDTYRVNTIKSIIRSLATARASQQLSIEYTKEKELLSINKDNYTKVGFQLKDYKMTMLSIFNFIEDAMKLDYLSEDSIPEKSPYFYPILDSIYGQASTRIDTLKAANDDSNSSELESLQNFVKDFHIISNYFNSKIKDLIQDIEIELSPISSFKATARISLFRNYAKIVSLMKNGVEPMSDISNNDSVNFAIRLMYDLIDEMDLSDPTVESKTYVNYGPDSDMSKYQVRIVDLLNDYARV